ncbi:MAG: type II toxin-antitoxin system RelE/ParE family toxin [Pirellulales bacterium]|nr:type II toxin-antitoxin system RelE/ParE family toxin [Pirellulales bacterium]
MPPTEVVFFQDEDGSVPVLNWIDDLSDKAQAKCVIRIERLEQMGHVLRRPEADYLRDRIYELRIGLQGINYRILYFFHGRTTAVLAHGLIKERVVPSKAINLVVDRMKQFAGKPENHTYQEG